jgi:tetratricopeptide (TPR) repeat protein
VGNWQHSTLLWERAVRSNPRDADACSSYALAVIDIGRADDAIAIVDNCLKQASSPRLVLRKALLLVAQRRRPEAIELLKTIATPAYPRAIADLAFLLDKEDRKAEALYWARQVGRVAPRYAIGQRMHGKIALAQGHADEALGAFERALELDPRDPANRYNLGLALLAVNRPAEADGQFAACNTDPDVGVLCRAMLARKRVGSPR